jgi:hypothetical protein
VTLTSIASSFRQASRALDTAATFDLEGVFALDDLPLRAAIVSEHDVSSTIARRRLDPLLTEGEFGATLIATMRAYLNNDMSIARTASALVVHPNTIRHRLHRAEEITGTDLPEPNRSSSCGGHSSTTRSHTRIPPDAPAPVTPANDKRSQLPDLTGGRFRNERVRFAAATPPYPARRRPRCAMGTAAGRATGERGHRSSTASG